MEERRPTRPPELGEGSVYQDGDDPEVQTQASPVHEEGEGTEEEQEALNAI